MAKIILTSDSTSDLSLELREKIGEIEGDTTQISMPTKVEVDNDAVIALMSLGFTKKECEGVVKEAEDSGITEISAIVTYALKHIR